MTKDINELSFIEVKYFLKGFAYFFLFDEKIFIKSWTNNIYWIGY